MEKAKRGQNAVLTVLLIYLVCYAVRVFEYFVLRTDQTWVGEAIVHKLIGILILIVATKRMHFTGKEIGFAKENSLRNVIKGLAFGLGVFAIAYAAEVLVAVSGGDFDSLRVYVSAYAVDQNIGYRTEIIFFLICIIGNIVNVVMEEGIFRGLFQRILGQKYSFLTSAVFASVLFGIWHVIGPVRNFLDGTSGMAGLIANGSMLLVTSALVGFKFAMLTELTGSQYMAMGDHFVNNTIVNLLHVVSDTGADELMVIRVSIAQSVSFILVLIYYIRARRRR